jgi:large subunit ribosomal protein L9
MVQPEPQSEISLGCSFDNGRGLHYQRDPVFPGRLPFSVMPFQEVILTEKIHNLGAESDVVRVRAGFARNFLIPQKKALEKTKVNLARINALKTKRAEREAKELNDAQEFARRINKLKITIEIETGETGKAFGSVTTADLADRIKAELGGNVAVDRHKIVLEHPIKSTGEFEIPVKLHSDVTAKFALVVKTKATPEAAAAEPAAAAEERPKSVKARPKK